MIPFVSQMAFPHWRQSCLFWQICGPKLRFTSADVSITFCRSGQIFKGASDKFCPGEKQRKGYSHANVYVDVSWPVAIHSEDVKCEVVFERSTDCI